MVLAPVFLSSCPFVLEAEGARGSRGARVRTGSARAVCFSSSAAGVWCVLVRLVRAGPRAAASRRGTYRPMASRE